MQNRTEPHRMREHFFLRMFFRVQVGGEASELISRHRYAFVAHITQFTYNFKSIDVLWRFIVPVLTTDNTHDYNGGNTNKIKNFQHVTRHSDDVDVCRFNGITYYRVPCAIHLESKISIVDSASNLDKRFLRLKIMCLHFIAISLFLLQHNKHLKM